MSVAAALKVGSNIVVRMPGLILAGKVEEVGINNMVKARLTTPWGVSCAFTEWFYVTDIC